MVHRPWGDTKTLGWYRDAGVAQGPQGSTRTSGGHRDPAVAQGSRGGRGTPQGSRPPPAHGTQVTSHGDTGNQGKRHRGRPGRCQRGTAQRRGPRPHPAHAAPAPTPTPVPAPINANASTNQRRRRRAQPDPCAESKGHGAGTLSRGDSRRALPEAPRAVGAPAVPTSAGSPAKASGMRPGPGPRAGGTGAGRIWGAVRWGRGAVGPPGSRWPWWVCRDCRRRRPVQAAPRCRHAARRGRAGRLPRNAGGTALHTHTFRPEHIWRRPHLARRTSEGRDIPELLLTAPRPARGHHDTGRRHRRRATRGRGSSTAR